MANALVTGANRGLGLEFTRQLAQRGDTVLALCRDPERAPELAALAGEMGGRIVPLEGHVTDPDALASAVQRATATITALDLLVNNAGVGTTPDLPEAATAGPLSELSVEGLLGVYRVNTVGPALVTRACADLLAAAPRARVVNVSSGLGSLGGTESAFNYGYSMSKAALNMLTRKLAHELHDQGTTVVCVNPGWVRTDMGGPAARLSPAESVAQLLEVIGRLGLADSGRFWDHSGQELPW